MNDTLEEIIVRVFDQKRITTSYIEHQPMGDMSPKAVSCRICVYLSRAIGRELASVMDGYEAVSAAAECASLMLEEIGNEAHKA